MVVGDALDRVRGAAGDPRGRVGVGTGEDERELVAADAEGRVGRAARGRDGAGGRAQGPVARRVAAEVVDRLEAVEIEDDDRQRERRRGSLGPVQVRVERVVELAVVEQPGERIAAGAGVVLGDREEVVEDQRGVLGEGGDRAPLPLSARRDGDGGLQVADRLAARDQREDRIRRPIRTGPELQLRLQSWEEPRGLLLHDGSATLDARRGRDIGHRGHQTGRTTSARHATGRSATRWRFCWDRRSEANWPRRPGPTPPGSAATI